MAVAKQNLERVASEEPDLEGASSEVHLGEEKVWKEVSIPEEYLEDNIEKTQDFSPETEYEEVGEETFVVEQDKADSVYQPETWEQLDNFLTDTSEIVETAVEDGFALDYKPANFGRYGEETLYIDNQDFGSVRTVDDPETAMATQLENHLGNNDSYEGKVPDRDEIIDYWN